MIDVEVSTADSLIRKYVGQIPEVDEVQSISAVPTVLAAVAQVTGLGFVCIASVKADSWTACAVLDNLNFGLGTGDSLEVTTTFCEQVRASGEAIVIDSVHSDARYRDHPIPRLYGFKSYVSVPIFRPDGQYFGTLCGLDTSERSLSNETTMATLTLFSELVSLQLLTEAALQESRTALADERESSDLREQFIAILGHDLRTPLSVISSSAEMLALDQTPAMVLSASERISRSVRRMIGMIDDLADFARGRMGTGIQLSLTRNAEISSALSAAVDELIELNPDKVIEQTIEKGIRLDCDTGRLQQLMSNLVKNAIVHGAKPGPVVVCARSRKTFVVISVSNSVNDSQKDGMEELFKPFRHSSDPKKHDGLGLGLYIVSEIAKSHGGSVAAEVKGSRIIFTVILPTSSP